MAPSPTHSIRRRLISAALVAALLPAVTVDSAAAAPAAPRNLTARVAAVGTVELSWTAPRGAVKYRLQRDGVRIASPTRPRHTDKLSRNGTFRYRVRAVDSRGAAGPFSAAVTVQIVGLTSPTGPLAGTPTVTLAAGGKLSAERVPVVVSWPAAGGATSYQLQRRVDGGAWAGVMLSAPTSTSATVMVRPGSLIRFQVRAVSSAGTAGPWARSESAWLSVVQDADWRLRWGGEWASQSTEGAFGGSLRHASEAGAWARLTFEARQVAWIASRGPARGEAIVSSGDRQKVVVDLGASSAEERQLVHVESWARDGSRTVEIEVKGTAGRPRVDLDGLVTLGAPPTAVLVGAGDIARCDDQRAAAAAAATGKLVSSIDGIVFTAGDNTQVNGTAAEFAECYDPRWGAVRNRTRPVAGNHEYHTARATPYYDYFGELAGPRHKGWYAYDAGTWRVYALNSNCAQVGGCGATSEQYKWLKADLSANPRRCVAAIWHHQSFSSGPRGSSSLMHDMYRLLYDKGAELLLSGHEHHYERFAPMNPSGVRDSARGIRYFIVGTGGTTLRQVGKPTATTQALDDRTNGVLKLTLGWSSYSWQFLPVPGGQFGSFTDAGSGTCH